MLSWLATRVYSTCRVKNCWCLCGIGVLVLVLQFQLLLSFFKTRKGISILPSHLVKKGSGQFYADVYVGLRILSQDTEFSLFLMKPFAVHSKQDGEKQCFEEDAHAQFGTLAHFASKKEHIFLNNVNRLLKPKRSAKLSMSHPTLRELKLKLTTHYLFEFHDGHDSVDQCLRRRFLVHIVVFHERPSSGGFWWQGPALAPPDDNSLFETFSSLRLPFWSDSAAIMKTEILPHNGENNSFFAPTTPLIVKRPFIECNRSQEQQFYKLFGPRDQSPTAELLRIKVRQVLDRAGKLLQFLGIPWWLSSGTCLGYFRQCDIIPHTTDIDIGVFIEHYNPRMIDLFSVNDLPLTHRFGTPNDSFELSFHDVRNDIKLDVFFFYRENDTFWNGGTSARTGQKYKYVFPHFEMCYTEFLDLLVQVPCPTLPYIEANYGSDWQIPKVRWDWKSSPSNVRENGIWPMERWQEVIQLYPLPLQQ